MTEARTLVSLRLDEAILGGVDAQIGVDGMRSRSDVIRTVLDKWLDTKPSTPGVHSVSVEFGTEMAFILGQVHQRLGHSPQELIKLAVREYVEREVIRIREISDQWADLSRPGYDPSQERPTE